MNLKKINWYGIISIALVVYALPMSPIFPNVQLPGFFFFYYISPLTHIPFPFIGGFTPLVIPLISVILGIIGINRAKKMKRPGLTTSVVSLVLGALLLLCNVCIFTHEYQWISKVLLIPAWLVQQINARFYPTVFP